jgi:hypothetical protein
VWILGREIKMDNNEQTEESDAPPSIIPDERIEGYSTKISRHPDDFVTDENVKKICVCENKWVENLAALSTPVRHTDYKHPDNELWLLATWTQIDILFEWRLQGRLWEGELVRVDDLPGDVELPEYERPFNYRYGEVEDNDQTDDSEVDS